MRSRRIKLGWPLFVVVMVVGYLARGRTDTTSNSKPPAARPAAPVSEPAPVAERPSRPSAPLEAPAPRPQAPPRQASTTPATKRDDKRLSLRVVGVHDGDTLTGLDDSKTQYKIRLDAIDAPELGQPFGQASKKALSEKVFGKDVVVIAKTRDKYGRTVGHVLIDGRDVNLEMLEQGMAWHYEKYDHNKRMREAEQSARATGRGLWADQEPVPPWDWRKERQHRKDAVKP